MADTEGDSTPEDTPPIPPQQSGDQVVRSLSWLSLLIGASVGITYTALAGLAYLRYPGEFSPMHNDTLSRLGNSDLNPDGALVYNIGAALTGALTVAFFASLGIGRHGGSRLQKRLLRAVQTLGAVGGVALIMAALYPEDQLRIHQVWSTTLFITIGSAILLSPFALRHDGQVPKDLVAVAVAAGLVDVASFVYPDSHWIEWATVALFFAYISALGLHSREPAEPDAQNS